MKERLGALFVIPSKMTIKFMDFILINYILNT